MNASKKESNNATRTVKNGTVRWRGVISDINQAEAVCDELFQAFINKREIRLVIMENEEEREKRLNLK